MTIGVWQPGGSKPITPELLNDVLEVAGDIESVDQEFVRGHGFLMKQEEEAWTEARNLSAEDLVKLIEFFTLAEMKLVGWEGGKQNPVIYLVNILKERDEFSGELRRWIKANTTNRYLPNGSAL